MKQIDRALANAMETLTMVSKKGNPKQIQYWQLAVGSISKCEPSIREERDRVMKEACRLMKVSPSVLFERYRGREALYARQLVYSYFAEKYKIYTGWTWMCLFGHHHTTVMNSMRQHDDLLEKEEDYQELVEEFLKSELWQTSPSI